MKSNPNYDKSNNVNFLDDLSVDEQHDLSYLLDRFIQWYENEYDEEEGECGLFGDSLKQLHEMADALQDRKCSKLSEKDM